MPNNPGGEPTTEELAGEELRRVQTVARLIASSGGDDLDGAMLIVANPMGIETYPYISPEKDPREMSLWLLGAFLAHLDDSTPEGTHPLEIADHALSLIDGYKDDDRVGWSIDGGSDD